MEAALAAIFQVTNEGILVAAGVFSRVGAVLFLLPGLGERAVPMRLKLAAALMITMLLSPLIGPLVPLTPETPVALAVMLAAEAVNGLIIGFSFRLLVWALQTAGMVAAQHISIAQMFGAGVSLDPEPTIATLLAMGGIVLMMMAGLHVQLVAILVELYDVLPFGRFPPAGDLADWAVQRVTEVFALGLSLAAPFVVIGFAYNIALGALNRAMPQLLVALVGVPFIIWLGIVVLYHILPTLYTRWGQSLNAVLIDPLGGL